MSTSGGWEPVQRLRTYEQVMAQIEERILDGRLSAGDHLPSERDFAVQLGVSRPSLRESLRVLEALGLVDIRRGGGADGGAALVGTPGPGFVNLLKLQLALGQFDQTDVLETRLALETWSAREAALRATAADHDALAGILDSMDDPEVTTAEFNRLDTAFHVRIAESAGNALTAHLMQSLRIAINRQMIEAYARLEDWRATAETVRREHRELLDAIRRREPDAAASCVQDHITDFYALGDVGGTSSTDTPRKADPHHEDSSSR
jgi:GntR family transcriptional repressor for pyruvate dehydrogenase complex